MARATANCTCEKCGKTFIRTKNCYNRTMADDWQEWAEKNITVCPECYKAEKKAEETKGCKEIVMPYSEYKKNYSFCKKGEYNADDKTIVVYVPADYELQKSVMDLITYLNFPDFKIENRKKILVNASIEDLKTLKQGYIDNGDQKAAELVEKIIKIKE